MWIEELVIVSYKCCRLAHLRLNKDKPNIFIGINDCGKTTVLCAIDLLLNERAKFSFGNDNSCKCDASNTPADENDFLEVFNSCQIPNLHYNQNSTYIIGKLKFEENDITADTLGDLSPHLSWVLYKNIDNNFWLAREFNKNTQMSTSYLLTDAVEGEDEPVYDLKAQSLAKKRKELEITDEEIENENRTGRFSNIEVMKAIYARLTLSKIWAIYNFKKDIQFYPVIKRLNWDMTLDELTAFATETINTKISTQIDWANRFAIRQASKAQNIINEELETLSGILRNDMPSLTAVKANVLFEVKSRVTDFLFNKIHSDGDIHLENQGEGVKRQFWFALLKYNALNNIDPLMNNKKFIWCFDEPETHLFPKAQREFFNLITATSRGNVQSILCTHSTVFVDRARLNQIAKVDLVNGYSTFGQCSTIDDVYDALQIRNSDFLFFDKFLVVEGDTEDALIPHLYRIHTNRALSNDSIQVINLGGKDKWAQNRQILEGILADFRKTSDSVFYLFDADAKHSLTQMQIDSMNCEFVGRQDIEDSVLATVWVEIVNTTYDGIITVAVEEIQNLIDTIPITTIQSNQKFYPKLKRLIREKYIASGLDPSGYDLLPSKGLDSGRLISEHITLINQISPVIAETFDRINAT